MSITCSSAEFTAVSRMSQIYTPEALHRGNRYEGLIACSHIGSMIQRLG